MEGVNELNELQSPHSVFGQTAGTEACRHDTKRGILMKFYPRTTTPMKPEDVNKRKGQWILFWSRLLIGLDTTGNSGQSYQAIKSAQYMGYTWVIYGLPGRR